MKAEQVIFLEAAVNDIDRAAAWYEQNSYGLGKTFRNAVITASFALQKSIISYRYFKYPVQCIGLKDFPFTIFYIEDASEGTWTVIAVLGNKQDMLSIIENRLS